MIELKKFTIPTMIDKIIISQNNSNLLKSNNVKSNLTNIGKSIKQYVNIVRPDVRITKPGLKRLSTITNTNSGRMSYENFKKEIKGRIEKKIAEQLKGLNSNKIKGFKINNSAFNTYIRDSIEEFVAEQERAITIGDKTPLLENVNVGGARKRAVSKKNVSTKTGGSRTRIRKQSRKNRRPKRTMKNRSSLKKLSRHKK
jgi:hypothetical protein